MHEENAMKKNMSEISNSFIGYDKEDIAVYLENLNKNHNQKVELVQKLIDLYKKKKDELNSEITRMQEEKKRLMENEDYLNFALQRADKAIKVLSNHTTKEEIPEIIKESKDKVNQIKKKLDRAKHDQTEIQKNTENFINDLNKLIHNLEETIKKRDNVVDFKTVESIKNPVPDRKRAYEEKPVNLKQTADGTIVTQNEHSSRIAGNNELARIIRSFKMGATAKKQKLDEVNDSDKKEKEETINTHEKEIVNKNIETEEKINTYKEVEKPKKMEKSDTDKNIEMREGYNIKDTRAVSDDDVFNTETPDIFNEQNTNNIKEPETPKAHIETTVDDFWGEIKTERVDINTEFSNQLEKEFSPNVKTQEYDFQSTDMTGTTPVRSNDVNTIRNKYIVGKIAGEALYDNNGSIIINKGETITKDIVNRADNQGKLSDLIINMILPDMVEV
jgi:hypothetical protein